MRILLAGAFLLTSALVASAQTTPPAAAGPLQQYDVPTNGKPQIVSIVTRDFSPGQSAGRHIHHGVEITVVMKGELELMVDGRPPHTYHAGGSFIVPRDVPHDAKNTGTTTTTLAITYVTDKGTPLRLPAP